MTFFESQQPILKKKQLFLDQSQLHTLKCVEFNFQSALKIPLCGIYTCIDQAMAIWGLISAIIFINAQFLPISWTNQAVIWSIATCIGILLMFILTYSWTILEGISWLLYLWIGLMLIGMILTDLAIAFGHGIILGNLCNVWLALSAIGYAITGWAMRSRAFLLAGALHSLTMLFLPLFIGRQFLVTGIVMATNLFIFTEAQWDMLLPTIKGKRQKAKG